MRQLLTILVLSFSISCSDNEQKVFIENLNCSTTSDKYVNFKIGDDVVCWTEGNPVRFDLGGSGNCGLGYENINNPFMATGVRSYVCNPSSDNCLTIDRSIIFNITFSCASYDTQAKFYNLIKVGDFSLAKSTYDFGKFYMEYYENKTWYTTRTGNQNDSRVEVLEVKQIAPNFIILTDGSKNGMSAALEVRLRASFNLYTESGQFFKRVSGSNVKGLFYRPTPWGQEWNDYYGE
jgi:hypothetical protein